MPLVDYFVICGAHTEELEQDAQSVLSSHLHPFTRSYTPRVLAHFPDRAASHLFDEVAVRTLCMPGGLTFKKNLHDLHHRDFHSFLITLENGTRAYGSVLLFYELVEDTKVQNTLESMQTKYRESRRPGTNIEEGSFFNRAEDKLYASKCICFVTVQPIFRPLRAYLEQLYAAATAKDKSMVSAKLPLESYLYNILYEVPLPPPGKTVRFTGPLGRISWRHSSQVEFPLCDYSFQELFRLLGVRNVIKLLNCILLEHQILLKSAEYENLMICAQCCTALLFPFLWPHVFVPILPASQRGFLDAPVPYIMGLRVEPNSSESSLRYLNIPNKTSLSMVDIDQGSITISEELPELPDMERLVLQVSEKVQEHLVECRDIQDLPSLPSSPESSTPITKHSIIQALRCMQEISSSKRRGSDLKQLMDELTSLDNPHVTTLINIAARAGVKIPLLEATELANIDEGMYAGTDDGNKKEEEKQTLERKTQWDYAPSREEDDFASAVREVFMNYFVEHFANYENFIIMPKQSYDQWVRNREQFQNFDNTAFLSDQPSNHPFYSTFLETSMFIAFIDKKIMAFWDSEQAGRALQLFDSKIEAYQAKSGLAKPPTMSGSRTDSTSSDASGPTGEAVIEETAPLPHELAKEVEAVSQVGKAGQLGLFTQLDATLLQTTMAQRRQPSEEMLQACKRGETGTVQKLISKGVDPSNKDHSTGKTPLHWASFYGHLDRVMLLITDGHCGVNSGDEYGDTPLHCACRKGHLDTVKVLITNRHCDVNVSNNYGCTPLHVACWKGHFKIVKWLIANGHCDVKSRDKSGDTPLHDACRESYLSIVKYLVVEGRCKVNISNISNNSGLTPLHLACWKDKLSIVECLISEGHCNVNIADHSGETPLHWACRLNHLNIIQRLTSERHCDVNIADRAGNTPLHFACKCGNSQIVHYLLSDRKCIVKKDDNTLLNLTDDPSTIRELLRHGANPDNVYAEYSSYLPEDVPKQPPESAVNIFTVGDHGTGKSTLVKALKKEGGRLYRVAGRLKKVTGVDENTAGIIPLTMESRFFGHVTLYDFAGHKEFYASHAAMIRQSMAGFSTAIFLLLADLRNDDGEFRQSILSWLSFIDNECPLGPKPHIIIVGSHADEIASKDVISKSITVDSLKDTDAFVNVEFKGYIAINCRYSESASLSQLRQMLAESCKATRLKSKPSFNTHCFSIYLLDEFRDLEAVKLEDILIKVSGKRKAKSDHGKLLSFIPTDVPRLLEMCEDLHDRGSILLLRNKEKPPKSWVILNQTALLEKVTGKFFAPKHFKQHVNNLASTTGVVLFTKFQDHFQDLDPDMVAAYLCHLEFCQEVTDDEVRQLLQTPLSISSKERVFFFPSLVSVDSPGLENPPKQIPAHASPTQIWKPNSDYVYTSGWMLQCSQPEHHFTSRFLQVLLLRLAFCFALAPRIQDIKRDLQREFYVWKRGICWVTRNGVGALVEMDKNVRTVTVLLRCLEHSKLKCIHLRSAIIHKALCAREEFCPKVSTSEYFIHPDDIECPLKLTRELNLFSLSQVTEAIAADNTCVIGKDYQPLHLEKLLYFEPYFYLREIVVQLFDEEKASREVDSALINQMAKCFHNKRDDVFEILRIPDSTLMEDTPPSSVQAIVRLLQLWCLHSRKGSYQCLHRKLDQFSVFAGRHPLSPTTSSLSAQSTAETTSEVNSTMDSTLIDSVDETTLDITALRAVNNELVSMAPKWMKLGLSFGLDRPVLDALKANYPRDVDRCLTETLARWLQQVTTARSWRAIAHSLEVSPINRADLAYSIAMSHGICTPKQRDIRYQDVNDERLGISNLREVSEEISTVYQWFNLGLALGLSFDVLKTIEIECHQDIQHCRTKMLKAWLNGMGGESSWRQLACALDSPLLIRTEIATMIATEHRI